MTEKQLRKRLNKMLGSLAGAYATMAQQELALAELLRDSPDVAQDCATHATLLMDRAELLREIIPGAQAR